MFLTLGLATIGALTAGTRTVSAERPNVIIFLADDAGWGDFGHSGNQQVRTPNIDALATQGVVLENFFVCPVCSPTRAELLTGRYHPRCGVTGVSTGHERINLDERTIADAFAAAGYATGAFGKWHNGSQWPYHPVARGFDQYFGHTAGHWGEYFDPPLENSRGQWERPTGYIVDVCTDRAIDFIRQHADQPFFCYVPFTTPHSPWAVPEDHWSQWKDRPITQRGTDAAKENLDQTRCALAMVENQDGNVGRVIQALDELGLTDDTIVVYFSDNGPNGDRWNGNLKGRKGSTDEGGLKSVCFLRWPAGLPAGKSVNQIAGAMDLLPTLLALTGVDPVSEKPLDGWDLSPLLLGNGGQWPQRMIFSTWAGRISARTQNYRFDHQGHLYDMRQDPQQLNPITEQHPDIVGQFQEGVGQWREEVLQAAGTADDAKLSPAERRQRRQGVDQRPIPVGFVEFPITILPARDGSPVGEVRRSSSAPNCSYFVNWIRTTDRLEWLVDVQRAGRYTVTIDYTCPPSDVGSTIQFSLGQQSLTTQVVQAWDPPLYTNQDTLPRPPAESSMKPFRTMELGAIELLAGEGRLTLQATEIPGQSVMDLRRITLRLMASGDED